LNNSEIDLYKKTKAQQCAKSYWLIATALRAQSGMHIVKRKGPPNGRPLKINIR
jgi:hypothetical protein